MWGGECHQLVWGPHWTHQYDSSHGPATLWRNRQDPGWDQQLANQLRLHWYERSRAFRLCWERIQS